MRVEVKPELLRWAGERSMIERDAEVDLEDQLMRKLDENERKYPAEQSRGRRDKYTSYIKPQGAKD